MSILIAFRAIATPTSSLPAFFLPPQRHHIYVIHNAVTTNKQSIYCYKYFLQR